MQWKRGRWLIAAAACILVGLAPQSVVATSKTETTDFEVQPVLPDAQANMKLNYFDLVYSKDTTHTIQMRVQNISDKNITVKSDLRNAYTQDGGGIDFTPSTKNLDRSLKNAIYNRCNLRQRWRHDSISTETDEGHQCNHQNAKTAI